MRTLTYCENEFEANLIVGRLENEGIKAVVLNNAINNIWPLSKSSWLFSTKVAVNEEDFNRAVVALALDESQIADS